MKANEIIPTPQQPNNIGVGTIVRFKETMGPITNTYGIVVVHSDQFRVLNLSTGHWTPAVGLTEIHKYWERAHGALTLKCADE